eukprot:TRINITY_DN120704_c0_g1_i1.p1 TRINITY_DN120704_c0_g1~~TRINITY_DN120704_c0_g1_i1.p1  ORF type:complete len:657 (-),score=104.29 TRINITY_DN120704_c0_g1_i1:257-2227(-)
MLPQGSHAHSIETTKTDAAIGTTELLKAQHEALIKVLESWLGSQEDRLSRLLASHVTSPSAAFSADQQYEAPFLSTPRKRPKSLTKKSHTSFVQGADDGSAEQNDLFGSLKSLSATDDAPRDSAASRSSEDSGSRSQAVVSAFEEPVKDSGRSERTQSEVLVSLNLAHLKKKMERDRGKVLALCSAVVVHPAFELSFAILVLVSAFITFLEVHLALESPTADPPALLRPLGHVLGGFFLAEILLRGATEGRAFIFGYGSGWNWFDSFLVASWFVELMVDVVQSLTASKPSAGSTGLSTMRLFRILRIAKMVRLLRIARILRFVRALNLLVLSIVTTLRSLIWASVLLLLIIFTFAICICQSVVDAVRSCAGDDCAMDPEVKRYWGSVPTASLTLFQMITGGKDWDDVARPLMELSEMMLLVLLIFIVFSQFAVLNVVTGVFCQAAVESAQRDREFMIQNILTNKRRFIDAISEQFANMFSRFSPTTDDGITVEDFERNFEAKGVQEYFALLELDATDAWMLFQLLDEDKSGMLDAEEFVDGCLRLKGAARSIDLAKLSKDFRSHSQLFGRELTKLNVQLQAVQEVLDLKQQRPSAHERSHELGFRRQQPKSQQPPRPQRPEMPAAPRLTDPRSSSSGLPGMVSVVPIVGALELETL